MPGEWTQELTAWLGGQARDAGFALAAVAPAPGSAEPAGQASAARFSAWIDAGHAGEMEYLKRRDLAGELLRRSARLALPWARSVVVCGLNYNLPAANTVGAGDPGTCSPRSLDAAAPDLGWIARYAWSGDGAGRPIDYHDDMLARLRLIEAGLRERQPCESKSFVDTGPLLERDFAARAGVGWVGRNTCVLNQQLGSWLLLGVIVTSLELPAPLVPALAADRCGSCTRCIEACPTDALAGSGLDGAPRQMDASRCIAYLTIEHKGAIAKELRAPMGRQVFGCDICQEVCPWNRQAPAGDAWGRREQLVNPPLAWLAELGAEGFRAQFRGSPLERTKRARLERNVAIAMGNSGEQRFRPQLEHWAAGDDAVLAESAAWALARLGSSASIGQEHEGPPADVDLLEQST